MNTNNLMAVAPQQAPQKGAKQGRTAKASGSASKDSFDDALGKLKEAAQEASGVPKDDSPQGKETMMDGGGARDSAPQDPLAAVLAASQQNGAIEAQDTAAEGMVAVQDTVAAVVDFSAAAQARTTGALLPQAQQQAPNLQALMPQSPEAASQSKDFLAMLSGQQLKGQQEQGQLAQQQTPLQMQLTALGRMQAEGTALQQKTETSGQPGLTQMPAQETQTGLQPQQMPVQDARPVLQAQAPAADSLLADSLPAEQQTVLREEPSAPGTEMPQVRAAAGQQATAAQASKQQPARLEALLGDTTVESITQEPDPLRTLHQQGLAQQGRGFMQQGQGQPQQQATAGNAPELSAAGAEAAEAGARQPQAEQGAPQAVNAMTSFQQEVQAAARTTEAPATQQPQPDFDVPRQIVEQARLIRSGSGDTEMVIQLKPEHLGNLTLKISVSGNGVVNASFHSDNAQVRAIIENSLVQLRQDLNDQGIKVDNVEVYAGLQDDQLPQGQGQAWQGGQGNASGRGQRFSAEDYADEAEEFSVLEAAAAQDGSEDIAATDGVDYRI